MQESAHPGSSSCVRKKTALIFSTRPEAIQLCPLALELRKHAEFQPYVCEYHG